MVFGILRPVGAALNTARLDVVTCCGQCMHPGLAVGV